jgi:hypothetical protein
MCAECNTSVLRNVKFANILHRSTNYMICPYLSNRYTINNYRDIVAGGGEVYNYAPALARTFQRTQTNDGKNL